MDAKPNLGGRPRKSPDGEARTETVKFMVTPAEKDAIRKAAKFYQHDEISMFIRDRIMRIVKAAESGSGVESVLAIGATSTDGWQRIPDIDLPPMEIVWDNDEGLPKLVVDYAKDMKMATPD